MGLAGLLLVPPAQAAAAEAAGAAGAGMKEATATPADMIGKGRPVAVTKATIEEIRAIAAKGDGKLLTFSTGAGAGVAYTITCVLTISPPFGGGSPGASVQVDSALQCTDWMDFVSLYVELWRDLGQAANSGAAVPVIPALYVSAREGTCKYGIYWGVATAFVRRSGFTPPSAFLHVHSVPLPVGCGSAPPPPPPPPAGAVTVNNPGNLTTYILNAAWLQMTATGGSGSYAWSATGLPSGLNIGPSTGLITGTTNAFGTYDVTVTAVSGVGSVGHTRFTWRVIREACPTC